MKQDTAANRNLGRGLKEGIVANRDPKLVGPGPWILTSPDAFSCVPTCIDGLLGTNLRFRKEGGYDLDRLLSSLDILEVPWLLGMNSMTRLVNLDFLNGIIAVGRGPSGMGHAFYRPWNHDWVDPKDGSESENHSLVEIDAYVYIGYGQR